MSKEKQCECCHEWWYDSDVKEDLCPNCYDYFKQLKQQLAEKDKEIKKLNWQLKDKDFIIKNLNHSLSVAPNANAGQRARIDELTKIVKEKDKEIEKLKQQYTILENENGKLTTELIMDKYKKAQKEVSFGKQLAIQELEKVKINLKDKITMMSNEEHCYQQKVVSWYNICNQINSQIEELKGEKNDNR